MTVPKPSLSQQESISVADKIGTMSWICSLCNTFNYEVTIGVMMSVEFEEITPDRSPSFHSVFSSIMYVLCRY